MTQFFAYGQAAYVYQMRKFLGRRHPALKLLDRHRPEGSQGRAPNFPPDVIAELEEAVNQKAEACEAPDTVFSERLQWACDYAGISDAKLARALGVSRQVVGGWRKGAYLPSRLDALAEQLNVPRAWLQYGGQQHLRACSQIGARVGNDELAYREKLYSKVIEAVQDVPDDRDEYSVNACLEQIVMETQEFSILARRAGGRWLMRDGEMLFVPWIPMYEHELTRRHWPDDVEAIISEELGKHDSVYSAWKDIKTRCKELGLAHPQKISIYKRIERQRQRQADFGVDATQANSMNVGQNR